jgi:hypothetical protein
MKATLCGVAAIVALVIAVVGGRATSAQAKQDKYTLQIHRAGSRSLRSGDTNNGR